MFCFISLINNSILHWKRKRKEGREMPPTMRHISKRNQTKQPEISTLPDFSMNSSEKDKWGWFWEEAYVYGILSSLQFLHYQKFQISRRISHWVADFLCLCTCPDSQVLQHWSWFCSSACNGSSRGHLCFPTQVRGKQHRGRGGIKREKTTWLQNLILVAKWELKISSCYILSTSARAILRFH